VTLESWTGLQDRKTEAVVGGGGVAGVDVDVDVNVDVEMVRSTGIDCVVLPGPFPETTIVVEYVPTPSPVMFGVTVSDPGAVPAEELSESHGAAVLALQSKVPDPELEILIVCAVGLLPPCVAEKSRPLGLRLNSAPRFKPYAWPFPFPGSAKPVPLAGPPSSAHPVSNTQSTVSPSVIEMKANDSRAKHRIVF